GERQRKSDERQRSYARARQNGRRLDGHLRSGLFVARHVALGTVLVRIRPPSRAAARSDIEKASISPAFRLSASFPGWGSLQGPPANHSGSSPEEAMKTKKLLGAVLAAGLGLGVVSVVSDVS